VLARYGIPLAAIQVQYSVLHREPETDGVLDACRRMNVAFVAYCPIGAARSATAAQVALAWLLKRDDHVIPIPGATRAEHVRENSGASRWN